MNPELVNELFQLVIIPLLGILVNYLAGCLKAKKEELKSKTDSVVAQKYIDMATNTVIQCVIATNQTYVNALKERGQFDEAAQKIAFQKTLNAVMTILSDEAKTYLSEITGDIQTYITELIEAEVNKNKE